MIVNRILQIIKYKGINKRKFYIETGLSNGFLDKVKDIGVSKIDHILNAYPEISVIWLITGRGKMLLNSVSDAEKDKVEEPSENIYLSASTKQQVPLYDINTPNGVTSLFQDSNQNPIDFISIPNLPKCDGAIRINGNSMHPIIKSGDIVIYKNMNNIIENIFWGELYLVSLMPDDSEELIMVKWIQKSEKGEDWIKLVSENPQHQSKDILISNIKGLALVKASIRINATH